MEGLPHKSKVRFRKHVEILGTVPGLCLSSSLCVGCLEILSGTLLNSLLVKLCEVRALLCGNTEQVGTQLCGKKKKKKKKQDMTLLVTITFLQTLSLDS